jgi:hypothetical protein
VLETLEQERLFVVRFVPLDMKPQSFTAFTAEIHGEHLVLKNSRAKLVAMFLSEIVESWSELPAHPRSSAAS